MTKFKVLAIALSAGVLASCSGLGKMQKCIGEVKMEASPNPLEVKGDKVAVSISTQFPSRYFNKTSKLEFKPTLTYSGGETAYKTYGLQGEKFAGNDKLISWKSGGDYTYTGEVAFKPEMAVSDLYLNITGYRGRKVKQFLPIKLGTGVITTAYLIQNDDKVLLGEDKFNILTQHQQKMVINYLVNSSNVLAKEKVDADVKETSTFLKLVNRNKDYKIRSVSVEAYASPEGELRQNENLAKERAESAKDLVQDLLAENKVKIGGKNFYALTPKGEDWQGFKELMEKSNLTDKDLILRMLTMYSDPQKREQEIRNLSATFTEVSDQILPKLRRATVSLNYDIQGKTDEQIVAMAKSEPSKLNAEELLYAATLTNDWNEKMSIYQQAETQFPADFRGANNIGVLHLQKGDMSSAKAKFEKAFAVQENAVTSNNLGVIARREGNRAKAAKYFGAAASEFNEAKYNNGLVNIQNGDYGAAVLNMKDYNTFNSALVYTLSKQYDKADAALKASETKDSAASHYLGAIIGARSGHSEVLVEQLTAAVKADASLKAKAAQDPEFIKYRDNAAFKALTK